MSVPDWIEPPVRARQRPAPWIALLLLPLVVLGIYGYVTGLRDGKQVALANADYPAFIAAARQAEAIADPLQRCLNYPALPGTHWSDETTKAYCQLRHQHTLQLSDIDMLLKQHKAADIDHAFQGYLDAQLHDPQQRGLLDTAFVQAGFKTSSAATRAVIEEWKRQSPGSAFAVAASGVQYVAAALQARGHGWARDLSEQQIDEMNKQLELARPELDRAVQLQPAMIPAYVAMISGGPLHYGESYMNQAALHGTQLAPADLVLRSAMMSKAESKWGGHFGGVNQQLREITALQASNPLLHLLVQFPQLDAAACDCSHRWDPVGALLPAADQGATWDKLQSLAEVADDHQVPRLAIELYSESLRFNPTDTDSLRWRADMLLKIGDVDGAIDSIARATRYAPDNDDIAIQLSLIYSRIGRVQQGEQTLLAVLQHTPDQQKAMAELGDLYSHAGHQPDKAMALADTLVSRHPDNPAGYVVRATVQIDNTLPGRYDTIHYFLDHFGNLPDQRQPAADMRAYLAHHPQPVGAG